MLVQHHIKKGMWDRIYADFKERKAARDRWFAVLNPIIKRSDYSQLEKMLIYFMNEDQKPVSYMTKVLLGRTDPRLKHYISNKRFRKQKIEIEKQLEH